MQGEEKMIRVMIVDDEPIIAQGLNILLDWKEECCEIVKTVENGKEALEYLRENPVDLILLDVQMPEMTGLEFLKIVREEYKSKVKVLILSGYCDFSYAQNAMQYQCEGYLLKPVQKEQLQEYLKNIRKKLESTRKEEAERGYLERGYLEQLLGNLIENKYTEEQYDYIVEQFQPRGEIRFAHITLDSISELEEMTDDEIVKIKEQLYENCCRFLGSEDSVRCLKNMTEYEEQYELAFIYSTELAVKRNLLTEDYFIKMLKEIRENLNLSVAILIGKPVESLRKLYRSYTSSCALRSTRSMYRKKGLYFYENEVHVSENKVVLCKKELDEVLKTIQEHNILKIEQAVDALFKEMEKLGSSEKILSMHMNYLMFQMAHMALERDESINQEEIMNYIGELNIDSAMDLKNKKYMRHFACEFSDYLIQLQKNHSVGVLAQIEQEIRMNYSKNLTLRDLGKKYFINSSYLGQMFRKKYGQSFKDYLCNYRINEAALKLVRTDKKISDIAEEVGYHDMDYFISRFIECKGCTPARYRKMLRES